MRVSVEIQTGNNGPFSNPTKADIQENIDAIERAISGKPLACDMPLLMGANPEIWLGG